MSNTGYKKYISVLVIVMLLLLLQSITVPAITIAEESSNALEEYRQLYEATDVLDDLEGVDLSGYEDMETISVISFNEFGYTKSDLSGYGLYMYVYNSTGNPIVNYSLNRVQISMDGSKYDKYSMTVLDKNDEGTIYKVKIALTSDSGTNIKSFVRGADERVYTVSGMEWATSMDGLNDYAVSYKFKYTGFASFEEGTESTLSCTVEQQDTVIITGLEDRQTVYRTDMDNQNMQSHNQINSVYFSVDNYFINTYGKLQQIEAEWWEYRTTPIVVTNNEDMYNSLMIYTNMYSEENPAPAIRNDEYWGVGDWKSTSTGGYGPLRSYNWTFNIENYVSENGNGVQSFGLLNNLYWILNTDQWGVDLDNYVISQEKLAARRFDFEQSQRAHFSEEDNGYSYCLELFNEEVGEGRKAGYNRKIFDSSNPDDMIDFKEYDPNYRGWDAFKNIFGWEDDFDEVLTDVSPIVLIDSSNSEYYLSGRNEEIADKMLIAVEDVPSFKQYVQTSISNDGTVVLFRFANTEYYSNVAHGYSPEDGWIEDIAFTAEENVFLNFDIMTLGFYDGFEYTVIPVVSSPIDIVSDIVGPVFPDLLPTLDGWGIMDYIYFAVMVIVAVIVLVVLYSILDMITNSVMRAPSSGNRNYNRRRRRR